MLAFGRVGDIFSHGRVFRIGLLWSGAAFLLCAVAPSYNWLLFCRFLQGIGASLIVSCAPALVLELFPEERRTRAVGAFALIYALGSAAGPLSRRSARRALGLAGGILVSRPDCADGPAASRRVAAGAPPRSARAGGCRGRRPARARHQHSAPDAQPAAEPGNRGLAAVGLSCCRGSGAPRLRALGAACPPADRQPGFLSLRRLRRGQSRQRLGLPDQLLRGVVRAILPRPLCRVFRAGRGRAPRRLVCRKHHRLAARRIDPRAGLGGADGGAGRPARRGGSGADRQLGPRHGRADNRDRCSFDACRVLGWALPGRLYGHRDADLAPAAPRRGRQHRHAEPLARRSYRRNLADPAVPRRRGTLGRRRADARGRLFAGLRATFWTAGAVSAPGRPIGLLPHRPRA